MPRLYHAALLLVVALAGCQSYRPSPLDLAGHDARWASREPGSGDVAAFAAGLSALGVAASAEPFDVADGLSLAEAEAVALFFNPRLRVARLKARVPLLGAREAGRWADPELAVDGERVVESVDDPWVLGGLISFTIPLSGRLGVERAGAFAEADAERLRAYAEEAAVLAELRLAWAGLSVTARRRELAAWYLDELAEVLRRAEGLLNAGELDPADVRAFRVERATRRAELQSLAWDLRLREAAVKGLLGLVPEADVALVPSLPTTTPGSMTPAERRARVRERHPRMLLARAEYEVAERALELEVRKQYPDLTLGGGFGTDEGQSRVLFGGGLPLPLLNRNRRAIAEARAARDAARAAAEGGYEELVAQLSRAGLAVEAARERRQFVETEVIPLVDEQVAELRKLGRLGDFNTLVLLEAMRAAYEAKVQLLDAALGQATTAHELDALSGAGAPPRPGATDGQP
jgi:cobalt-zinc-cadmium efflux system outer membrane protein